MRIMESLNLILKRFLLRLCRVRNGRSAMSVLSITRTIGVAQPVGRDLNTREASIVRLYDNCSNLLLIQDFSDFVTWDQTGSIGWCIVNGMLSHVLAETLRKYVRTMEGEILTWEFDQCGYLPHLRRYILSKRHPRPIGIVNHSDGVREWLQDSAGRRVPLVRA